MKKTTFFIFKKGLELILFFPMLIFGFLMAFIARFISKGKAIGLGPEPLINNVHHKKALKIYGYQAETFVSHLYYITKEFDVIFTAPFIRDYYLFFYILINYKIIYIYFNGGPLAWTIFSRIEPYFYRVANIKVVAMPYGGDVQDFSLYHDVVYKNAYIGDYPDFILRQMKNKKKNISRWVKHASWIIAGCDWVNYLPYWNTLMLTHFSVDTDVWKPDENYIIPDAFTEDRPLKILHAPNHRKIKGSDYIEKVVRELKENGYPIELILVQRLPNEQLREVLKKVDVVLEQLIIGWYGIAALEAMACKKPVLCYISEGLEKLYVVNNLLEVNELPIIKVNYDTLWQELVLMVSDPEMIKNTGEKGRKFVEKHHSLEYIGSVFDKINRELI